jgi:hypothetical protein
VSPSNKERYLPSAPCLRVLSALEPNERSYSAIAMSRAAAWQNDDERVRARDWGRSRRAGRVMQTKMHPTSDLALPRGVQRSSDLIAGVSRGQGVILTWSGVERSKTRRMRPRGAPEPGDASCGPSYWS